MEQRLGPHCRLGKGLECVSDVSHLFLPSDLPQFRNGVTLAEVRRLEAVRGWEGSYPMKLGALAIAGLSIFFLYEAVVVNLPDDGYVRSTFVACAFLCMPLILWAWWVGNTITIHVLIDGEREGELMSRGSGLSVCMYTPDRWYIMSGFISEMNTFLEKIKKEKCIEDDKFARLESV